MASSAVAGVASLADVGVASLADSVAGGVTDLAVSVRVGDVTAGVCCSVFGVS